MAVYGYQGYDFGYITIDDCEDPVVYQLVDGDQGVIVCPQWGSFSEYVRCELENFEKLVSLKLV